MNYNRYTPDQYSNDQQYYSGEDNNTNNMTRIDQSDKINDNNVFSNIGHTNQLLQNDCQEEEEEEEETHSPRITNEVVDHYLHKPRGENRYNTVDSSVLRPNDLLQEVLSTGGRQEIPLQQNSDSESAVYDRFIRNTQQNTTRPNTPSQTKILTPPAAYNDVFIQNHSHIQQQDTVGNMFQVPSINVIQTPSDFTYTKNNQLESQNRYGNLQYSHPNDISINANSQYATSQQYFNDDDYYHFQNNSTDNIKDNHYIENRYLGTNNLSQSTFSEAPSVISLDEDTKPILQQQAQVNSSGSYHYNNYNNVNNLQDLEKADGYIDQSGDDYQIRSYLDNDGEMVNPYTNTIPVVYDKDEDLEGDVQLRNDNDISHIDLGDSSNFDLYDTNTIEKSEMVKTRSINSGSNSSSNSKGVFFIDHNEDNVVSTSDNNNSIKRSNTEVRKFKLWNGNFVFDSPISSTLLNKYNVAVEKPELLSNEFKFMRYQAVTCEPNELAIKNFTVRQLQYLRPRQTELMIVITMYNEDHILLGRTLKGVMDNIKHMVKKTHSSIWGPDAWKKIVVCIISDGRSKINERALALLSSLGCYQDGFAKDEINDTKVAMHMYEHTTMMNITSVTEHGIELACNQNTVPVQLLFGLKEQNQKKINSHRWAFEGFAELLQPNVVTLLDAGTMPGKDSIYKLWKEFKNPNVGGACGEIKTDLGKNFVKLLNPLVASQNFEYKMSNILDKTTESNFGFITVLPGAFSAYRLAAVRGTPLEKYFYGEGLENKGFNFFSSNMYLAEDRILCFEIVTKKESSWILKYCRSSYASTDVPERVPEFILQRRRWLNGSFFAGVYSFCHIHRIWTSGHNVIRKLWFTIEFLYLFFNTLISWFSLSSFFLVFRILSLSIASTYHRVFGILSVVFLWLYGVSVFSTFVLSLGNKPKSTEKYYVLNFLFFAVLMAYMVFCSFYMSVKSFEDILEDPKITFVGLVTKRAFRDLVISMGSTYALYFISSIIYLQPWHMLTSFVQYILLSPAYINILNIYAFCNVHDLSWGTKGAVAKPLGKINSKEDGTFKMEILVSQEEITANYNKFKAILDAPVEEKTETDLSYEEKKTGYYANVRSLVIIFWVLTNFGIVAAVLETGGINEYITMNRQEHQATEQVTADPIISQRATIYFTVILWLVAFSALIRFIGCTFYMMTRLFKKLSR